MTTETKQAPETMEEIAQRIATRAVGRNPNCETRRNLCEDAILSALRNERDRCWREITAQADEWRRQARLPGAKRNTLNQMAHGAVLAANSLRKGE